MSTVMEDEIKRWTAKRKSALVMEILQGKPTVAEASRSYDLPPPEIETWIDEAKRGPQSASRSIFASVRSSGFASTLNSAAPFKRNREFRIPINC